MSLYIAEIKAGERRAEALEFLIENMILKCWWKIRNLFRRLRN
jgi:hypothetical protein